MSVSPVWFVGVDGGATRCRARVRDGSGAMLAESAGAAANVHVDFAAAVETMRAVVAEAIERAGLRPDDRSGAALGLGLAGLNDAVDAARVAAAFPGFARVVAANDAVTACAGAHAGADGGLVIAGTGSAAIARIAGREVIAGGRGFTLGDDGSGSHIGLDAMRAAIRSADGLGPTTAVTRAILSRFDGDAVALVRWARDAAPGDFGAYAPLVFECAGAGDPLAQAIVRKAAGAIGVLARRAAELGAERVALVGGVGEALRPWLAPELAAQLTRPIHDATDGAILLAGGRVATAEEIAG